MPNLLQQAGAIADPSPFAALHTNRIFTGLWTNRSFLRDAATTATEEAYGLSRKDSILDGYNSEITPRLTLSRRPGSSVFNNNNLPPIKRFYSFNTFTLTDESIRVLADSGRVVYDLTGNADTALWNKSAGAGPTHFLGVGNLLYFTNGVENKQWDYVHNAITNWGIEAPTTAPIANVPPFMHYGSWQPGVVFFRDNGYAGVVIIDSNGNMQVCTQPGRTGTGDPGWATQMYYGTQDGTVGWQNRGIGAWVPNHDYSYGDLLYRQSTTDLKFYFYMALGAANSGYQEPTWTAGVTSTTTGTPNWLNLGQIMYRADVGDTTDIVDSPIILDSNNNIQTCKQAGKTGTTQPSWSTINNAFTSDPAGNAMGVALWQNGGGFNSVQYGYAYMNSKTGDISNMSPASAAISTHDGSTIDVSGDSSSDPQVDTIIIFRTLHGGSTFLYAGQISNPGGGQTWLFEDSVLDADLNTEWQAQVTGEGTPLPVGATALGYHLGRIFAAVGNVVYVSSGPDAAAAGSSGNSGFNTTFTLQSKITRFWANSLGMVVFTVRDAYIILGSATSSDPLYVVVFIEDIPLRSYDCLTINKTTAYLLMGNNVLLALDPSAGLSEIGFPIADRLLEEFDASASYLTYHKESSRENALYVANGVDHWYRLAMNNAPESGSAWSPRAEFSDLGCVQSVEVNPGQFRLLISGTDWGPILQRDSDVSNDNGELYPVMTRFGAVVLAVPGQLAALAFATLEGVKQGTRPALAMLLGERDGTFEPLRRTRQDPTNLPPSDTLYSDRYHFEQNQQTAWCRHFQWEITWPAEDAKNELLSFTFFGQTWQEPRGQ